MKKLQPLIIIVLTAITFTASAQSGFNQLLTSAPGDATKLVNAYATPLFKGFGVGLNSGWTNTAETNSLLHFDLRFTGSLAMVPSSDKTFDVTKIGLSGTVTPADPTKTIAPTIGGASTAGPVMNINSNGSKISSFTLPQGQLSVIPTPQLQLTVGLIDNTDVTLRAIPSINVNNVGSVSMIGFGLKHNIMRDIVGKAATFVPFDVAVSLGYSHLDLSIPLNVQPASGAQPINSQQSSDFSNQHIQGTFSSFVAEAIISKKVLFFTPFLAVGFNTASTSAGAIGNYPVTSSASITGQPYYTTFSNPVSINQTSINGVRADLGFQLKLGFFRFYASYSAAQYSSVNGGIGFGF